MNGSSRLVIFFFVLAVILSSTCVAATRPLRREGRPGERVGMIESLQRGPVSPSGSSSCTNIPGGGGGGHCP
ncbi:hypothetical protein BT93_G1419 [Corymbia citriodora subsp. variegata]|nr:hypothetical protein BT93_G1419 [Corymbia citriodora subsp. variegata]